MSWGFFPGIRVSLWQFRCVYEGLLGSWVCVNWRGASQEVDFRAMKFVGGFLVGMFAIPRPK